jgi:hypothetical protein
MNTQSTRSGNLRNATLVAAAAAMLAMACAAPAMAASFKEELAVFAQCPVGDPEVNLCFYLTSTGGEFTLGNRKVPIAKTLTFQGGMIEDEETGSEQFVGAANGETLSKTPLQLPGGLLGLVAPASWPKGLRERFNKFINEGITGVTATLELVGNPGISRSNIFFEEGIGLSLPLRVHLNNAFLGGSCYIGSEASPINLELTTGLTSPPPPNKAISGQLGKPKFFMAEFIIDILENKLVDNSFSEPRASGCGGAFSFLIDPALDARLSLPSPAGRNTAVIEDEFINTLAETVRVFG